MLTRSVIDLTRNLNRRDGIAAQTMIILYSKDYLDTIKESITRIHPGSEDVALIQETNILPDVSLIEQSEIMPRSIPRGSGGSSKGTGPSRRAYVVACLCSLSFLTIVDRVCISAAKSNMSGELGITDTAFGWVFGAFAARLHADDGAFRLVGGPLRSQERPLRSSYCFGLFSRPQRDGLRARPSSC